MTGIPTPPEPTGEQTRIALPMDIASVRARLRNPPGARFSTEVEGVLSQAALRQQRIDAAVRQAAESDAAKWRAIFQAAAEKHAAMQLSLLLMAGVIHSHAQVTGGPARVERRVTMRAIIQATCQHYNIGSAYLMSDSRHALVVRARQIGMYVARETTVRSYPEIARAFNRRDHTTALHAHRKVAALIGSDLKLAAEVEAIRAAVVGG
jgi:hypothetical protein